MAKKKERTLITALLALGLGILLVVFREYAFGLAIFTIGIAFVVSAVIDLFNNNLAVGLVRLIIGNLIMAFGSVTAIVIMLLICIDDYTLTEFGIVIILIGILLIIDGVLGLIKLLRK